MENWLYRNHDRNSKSQNWSTFFPEDIITRDMKIGICGPRDFWGIGLSIRDEAAKDHSHWKGENKLGKILSDLRAKYKG